MNNFYNQSMDFNDQAVDLMLRNLDDTVMPIPSIDDPDPLILIAKVRKEYFDYLIKYLSINYENHQKLLGKNIYLPSAIWRCAKYMELQAVKLCMVADLYRKNMTKMLNELKLETKKGRLNKQLFNCLKRPPTNEKKLQTTSCTCQCICSNVAAKRRKTISTDTNRHFHDSINEILTETPTDIKNNSTQAEPSFINTQLPQTNPVNKEIEKNQSQPSKLLTRMSTESQHTEDEVMLQMEQLFRADSHEAEDDLFEGTLCDDTEVPNDKPSKVTDTTLNLEKAQIKSLDERLAMMETSGILHIAEKSKPVEEAPKPVKPRITKWLCESYFQKKYLFERMDDIRERNRKKHLRIRQKFFNYFGEDSDGEDEVMSPMEDTPEFTRSCKERIAPWVVKLLTPHYVKGRIIGKNLFKACAKHLINLIIICSQYPEEHDVKSFIADFLKTHKMIRCEADFIEFRIANI